MKPIEEMTNEELEEMERLDWEKALTLQKLKDMEPGTVFAKGEIENSPEGIYMSSSNIGKKLKWVAKRGIIHDWAIYTHWAEKGYDFILKSGDKVTGENNIKKLVQCTKDAFEMYRY